MQNFEIIKELESNNSRIFKEKIILREMDKGNDIFFEALNFACDKLVTFGVKQIVFSNSEGSGISWDEFKLLLLKLNTRELTGNNARDQIILLMKKSGMDEWNFFYRRILIKDLRCGVSEKTINNVAKKNKFKKYQIPVFQCQLAQDSENHKKKLTGKKILEVKLDGIRVITIIHINGTVDMFSRNGKELLNFENVKNQIVSSIRENKISESIVLDGELVSKNFQELMKQVYRKDNIQNNDANLFLFDYLSFEDFKKGESNVLQIKRIENLKKWYQKNISFLKNIKIMNHELVNLDIDDGKSKFKEFNNQAVVDGYEGIMIKDPSSKYECKRSSSWLKSKPVIEVSLIVNKVEEGTGKNKGRLGAIYAEGKDNNKNFRISVGSGFTDLQREEFWKNRDYLEGKVIEIKADAVTRSQEGEFWSLRFPRFKTFRGFKHNEKI
jgi:DNA ligase 1